MLKPRHRRGHGRPGIAACASDPRRTASRLRVRSGYARRCRVQRLRPRGRHRRRARSGRTSGGGAIAGAIIGGVLGHQIGSGRGNDVATVAGAIGGAVAGNEIERVATTTSTTASSCSSATAAKRRSRRTRSTGCAWATACASTIGCTATSIAVALSAGSRGVDCPMAARFSAGFRGTSTTRSVERASAARAGHELRAENASLASLSAFLQTHVEREKARLARELHDQLGGILTPAKMDLAWLASAPGRRSAVHATRMERLDATDRPGHRPQAPHHREPAPVAARPPGARRGAAVVCGRGVPRGGHRLPADDQREARAPRPRPRDRALPPGAGEHRQHREARAGAATWTSRSSARPAGLRIACATTAWASRTSSRARNPRTASPA